ncbi:hypothetical protein HMPREF9597_02337 [Cutibacterium acnes HL005PA4]|nr:hypothetical protein HMPREF9597_02337 [Cutibacterium acnes HL005PA4]
MRRRRPSHPLCPASSNLPKTDENHRDTRARQLYRWVSRTTANTLVNSYWCGSKSAVIHG